jgi:hypothetical protein
VQILVSFLGSICNSMSDNMTELFCDTIMMMLALVTVLVLNSLRWGDGSFGIYPHNQWS